MVAAGPLAVTARSTAKAFGLQDLTLAEIHTPLFGKTEAEIATLALEAATEVTALLCDDTSVQPTAELDE